jgi:hypothetical protein
LAEDCTAARRGLHQVNAVGATIIVLLVICVLAVIDRNGSAAKGKWEEKVARDSVSGSQAGMESRATQSSGSQLHYSLRCANYSSTSVSFPPHASRH